jgi:gliding motility-associated-like protein
MQLPSGVYRYWTFPKDCYDPTKGVFRDTIYNDTAFTISFADTGHYSLGFGLYVPDGHQGADHAISFFNVLPCPSISNFSVSADTLCTSGCLQVKDKSKRKPTHWHWTFEGANIETYEGQNPSPICYAQSGIYTISLVTENKYGKDSLSKNVLIRVSDCDKCIFIPNAFSPNNDGYNDVFETFTICPISHYHLSIFDRWGVLIFASENQHEKWDGTYKGEKLNPQILVYQASITYDNDRTENYKGSLTLIR